MLHLLCVCRRQAGQALTAQVLMIMQTWTQQRRLNGLSWHARRQQLVTQAAQPSMLLRSTPASCWVHASLVHQQQLQGDRSLPANLHFLCPC